MALQGSGSISLSDIQTEFGGTNPILITEYYGSGGVPSSGSLSISDFYGTSNSLGYSVMLTNPNPYGTSDYDNFGRKVAISGNYAIAGAYGEDDAGGDQSGKAYIFNATTGALLHTLDDPNPYGTSADDYFGRSVAISGNYAIVGAYGEDDVSGDESGKAYIYNVTTGALVHTLDNPNPYGTSAYDNFGRKVAMGGNYAMIGAMNEDETVGYNSGKAYIFNVTTGALFRTLDDPNAYGNVGNDQFGWSGSIDGNYVIVGAIGEDDAGGNGSGKAYIFNITTGALLQTLDNPNADGDAAYDYFGRSVAISGNYAIAGAHGEDKDGFLDSGKAYIFNVTTGALLHTLDNPNPDGTPANDSFGIRVSISGNYALVGSYNEGDGVFGSGKAYIYNVTTGALLHTLDNPNAYGDPVGDQFGWTVAIDGNKVIIGAYGDQDASGNNSGKAYIYDL